MRISDWSSDVCSSDLRHRLPRLSTSEPPRKITNRKISITEDFWGILLQIIPVIIHEAAVVHFIDNLIKFNLGKYRMRSEERRVGKECVRTCRSRGSLYH